VEFVLNGHKELDEIGLNMNFLNFIFFYLHKTYWYGRINFINYNSSYQEWLREWPDEARQPAQQGANSNKMSFILGDKVLTSSRNTFPRRKGVFLKGGRINLKRDEREEIFRHLEKMLETLHYGSITLVVQDGKIIQIEKNEKVRLQPNKNR
jgi:hypothetical protein